MVVVNCTSWLVVRLLGLDCFLDGQCNELVPKGLVQAIPGANISVTRID